MITGDYYPFGDPECIIMLKSYEFTYETWIKNSQVCV
jgi:hypothetical protein